MQIAINLISNAINNTFEGKVSISCGYSVTEQQISIEVKDTGIGMKPEDQD
jgi:signal transduction histidine kinase